MGFNTAHDLRASFITTAILIQHLGYHHDPRLLRSITALQSIILGSTTTLNYCASTFALHTFSPFSACLEVHCISRAGRFIPPVPTVQLSKVSQVESLNRVLCLICYGASDFAFLGSITASTFALRHSALSPASSPYATSRALHIGAYSPASLEPKRFSSVTLHQTLRAKQGTSRTPCFKAQCLNNHSASVQHLFETDHVSRAPCSYHWAPGVQ